MFFNVLIYRVVMDLEHWTKIKVDFLVNFGF